MAADAEAPCVIDVEASGFGPGSYPIEVGFVLPDGRAHCTLVRPLPAWTHWSAQAEAVHGIGRELAHRYGREPEAVADWLNRHLDGRTVYSDGWAQDFTWLALLFDAAGRRQRFRVEHLRALLDEAQARRLAAVHAHVLAELRPTRHRASADARALQLALRRVRQPPP